MDKEQVKPITIYTEEQIDMLLSGENRQMDRLLMHGMNSLSSAMVKHTAGELRLLDQIESVGGFAGIKERAKWVDMQMMKDRKKIEMMDKVTQSTYAWALVSFLGYAAWAVWENIITKVRG